MKLSIAVLLIATTLAAIPTKVTNCMENPTVVFTAATFSVEPAKGVDETITLYGTANGHAQLENVQLRAYWNKVEVFTENFPESDEYDEGDPVVYSLTQNFPSYTPSGLIEARFYFQNAKGTAFGCASVSLNL